MKNLSHTYEFGAPLGLALENTAHSAGPTGAHVRQSPAPLLIAYGGSVWLRIAAGAAQ